MRLFAASTRPVRLLSAFSLSLLAFLVSVTAHADKVHLHSGSVLEGKVTREGDKVVVQLESGTIRLDAASVVRIESAVTPLEQITRLRAALPAEAIGERIELANKCREAELVRCERELLEEVIARAPEHAEARVRLGYVRSEGAWISRDEQAQKQARAREHERDARLASERAVAQAELLRETAELSRKQAELAVERERLALEKAQVEQRNPAGYYGYGYGYVGAYYGHYPLRPPPMVTHPIAPFVINGVRSPGEPGFNLPGVRSPASYFH
jgi:hypothetical protein